MDVNCVDAVLGAEQERGQTEPPIAYERQLWVRSFKLFPRLFGFRDSHSPGDGSAHLLVHDAWLRQDELVRN
jgi:hypothetical protein